MRVSCVLVVIVVCTLVVASATVGATTVSVSSTGDVESMWTNFKSTYNRVYRTKEEEAHRFDIFVQNLKGLDALRKSNPHAEFGVNKFSDRTDLEMERMITGKKDIAAAKARRDRATSIIQFSDVQNQITVGQSINWTARGAVTPAKDQGWCGSCFAFSTTGNIESQWFLAGHRLVNLSEQEIVSCDSNKGCDGGWMDWTFDWILERRNGWIATADSYPYVSGENGTVPKCNLTGKTNGAKIESWGFIQQNEKDIATYVLNHGPVTVAIDANSRLWFRYKSGIISTCAGRQMNHAVVITGFDDAHDPPYWIIKNSWGDYWGENGFMRIQKGTDQCGIADFALTSIVKSVNATPAPAVPASNVTTPMMWKQLRCEDPACDWCDSESKPLGVCINATTFGYIATCTDNALLIESFASPSCEGTGTTVSKEINKCQISWGLHETSFVQNRCGPAVPAPPSPPTAAPVSNRNDTNSTPRPDVPGGGPQGEDRPSGAGAVSLLAALMVGLLMATL